METFKSFILGGLPFAMFAAALFFSLLGVTINLLMDATTRKPESEDTPVRFSFWFLMRDNWKRIMLSILLIVVTIRFCEELTGLHLNMFVSLLIGFVFDKLSEFLKDKSNVLKVNRDAV
jgi:hypothetical protein